MLTVAFLVACGGSTDTAAPAPAATQPVATPAETTTAPIDSAPADAVAVAVPAALDFSAPLLGGGEIELGALSGRPVLLWFWAPW